jgi:hypothetical protein
VASTPKASVNVNFSEEMGKIQSLYLYSLKLGVDVRDMAKTITNIDMTSDQFQACVSSIFIEANRRGLANHVPTSTKSE